MFVSTVSFACIASDVMTPEQRMQTDNGGSNFSGNDSSGSSAIGTCMYYIQIL